MQTQFNDHVKFQNGKYVVSLPWKDPCLTLPDNYNLSLHRLTGLFKRLKSSPDLLKGYDDIIKEQLAMGIIVPVDDTAESSSARIHYLPHHAVLRHDKSTTKLRIVYDASAKTNGPSLNNCLHVGPSLHQKIFNILLRFRMWPIAIIAGCLRQIKMHCVFCGIKMFFPINLRFKFISSLVWCLGWPLA